MRQNPRRRGAVAVVLRDQKFLVICRSELVVAPGAFCFPGGGIEPGESEEQALVREFYEELGAEIRPLRRVWQSTTRWQVELAWWLGEVPPQTVLTANPAEVASVHWLSPAEMLTETRMLESNRGFLAALAAGEFKLD
jgi:8-oxo-dGTP diphosphatase